MVTALRKRRAQGTGALKNDNVRTTVTLPVDLVRRAEMLAKRRRQTLSATIADLMEQGLRTFRLSPGHGTEVLRHLRKAFAGLSEEEMMLVDGIVLGDPTDSK